MLEKIKDSLINAYFDFVKSWNELHESEKFMVGFAFGVVTAFVLG